MNLIENEKKIISLTRANGSVSMPDICAERGVGCGWATAHKLVKRLINNGILVHDGTVGREGRYGKSAKKYRLNPVDNVAIGIDVEKSVTTTVLVTLEGEIVWQTSSESPVLWEFKELMQFLGKHIKDATKIGVNEGLNICGIGIGVPLTSSQPSSIDDIYGKLSQELTKKCKIPCAVENNISAFADYLRYNRKLRDFLLITIRTGVGGGLVINNTLQRGMGNAAEMGHVPVSGNRKCICGRTGCLETEVSLPAIAEKYAELSGGKVIDPTTICKQCSDDSFALQTLEYIADKLFQVFNVVKVILDLPHYLIGGDFGQEGRIITELIVKLDKTFKNKINYVPIKDTDFDLACAHLFHKNYFLNPCR